MAFRSSRAQWVNLKGAETGMLCDILNNTVAADALAPCIARPTAAVVLTIQDKQDL